MPLRTSIQDPRALEALAKLAPTLGEEQILSVSEDYQFEVRKPWAFRSSNRDVSPERIVLECNPGLEYGHGLGIDLCGRVFLGRYSATAEEAYALDPETPGATSWFLSGGQRLLISHVIVLIECMLALRTVNAEIAAVGAECEG